jgi:hypothetical protein
MSEYIQSIVKDFSKIPGQLKNAETFCMAFAIDFLKERSQSGNFSKAESHYDMDGLVTTYQCAIDGRIYTVKVTPSKP